MATLYGISVSPFVRKVKVYAAEKGISLEYQAQAPSQEPAYLAISPLGKVPAFRDGDLTLADSTVIIAYLEKTQAGIPLYPADAGNYAKALWFEEYADSKCFEVLTRDIFFQRVIMPKMYGKPGDAEVIKRAVTQEMPKVFDYLEGAIGKQDFLVGGKLSVADLAVATHFVNLQYGQETVDSARWPNLARYIQALLARPSFQAAMAEDRQMMAG